MSAQQQPSSTPQAPAAPAAPALPNAQAPSQADLARADAARAREIGRQARTQAQAQRDAAQAARDAAQAARDAGQSVQQNGPVILVPGHRNGDFPMDPAQIRAMAENISSYFFMTVAVIAIGVPLVRAIGRRFGPAPIAPPLPKSVSDQLQRIETAVESMAIEVERISEAQRFLTRLQTGQPQAQPAALPPHQGT